MSLRGAYPLRTICELLREIYDLSQENNEKDSVIRKKLCEAEKMVKKMSYALLEYNKKYDEGWWEQNRDYEQDLLRDLNHKFIPEE